MTRSATLGGSSLDALEPKTLSLLVLLVALSLALLQLVGKIEDPLREGRDLVGATLIRAGAVLGSSVAGRVVRLSKLADQGKEERRVFDVLEQLVVCRIGGSTEREGPGQYSVRGRSRRDQTDR